jgi:adenosylcobinamide-GDP ribazoletransferase
MTGPETEEASAGSETRRDTVSGNMCMKKFFRQLFFAFGFLTILPGLGKLKVEAGDTGKSVVFYPVVGLLIGFFLYLISLLNGLSPLTRSALMVIFTLFFSRFIHADGLMDTMDGFLSGRKKPQDIITVMRDSQTGALGFMGGFSIYVLKICLFYEIISNWSGGFPYYLLAVSSLSRGGVAITGFIFPYAGGERGLGSSFVSSIGLFQALVSFLMMGIISFSRQNILSLISAPAVGLFWVLWGLVCKKKIGGITGDTLGAGIEMSELFYLAMFIVFL